jgi:hypothetical protein
MMTVADGHFPQLRPASATAEKALGERQGGYPERRFINVKENAEQ